MKSLAEHIRIQTISEYLPDHSQLEQSRFAFAYTITISNLCTMAARLLTRHWVITDANGQVQEVHGKGVIGEQPLIQPKRFFRYTSGTVLPTPVGTMQGTYEMITEAGEMFEVVIPTFRLAIPELVH